ncbi:MAG: hypothetical protein RR531_14375, partial [Longicatena sp.]
HKTDSGVDAVTDNSDFHGKYYGIKDPQMAKNVFTVNSVDNLIRNKMYFNGNVIQSDYEKYLINTGKDASEYPDSWKNTHTWTVEELDGLATSAEATNRQLFPTSFEKNIYMSGNEFLKIKNKGYNIIGLTSPYQEEDGSSFKRKFNAASNAFKDWFELNIGTRYESTKNESMRDILDDLSAEWSYLIGKGEIVDTVNDKFIVIDGFETVSLNN